MSFEVRVTVDVQIDGESLYRKCIVSGDLDNDENPSSASVAVHIIEFDDQPAQMFRFGFSRDEEGLLQIALPNIGDPLTDYTICVAGKIAPAVAAAAYACFMDEPDWRAFLVCMKRKAPAIGYKAIWSLLTCTRRVVGID